MKFFWPFRFDENSGELWRRTERLGVTPKAGEVLRSLIRRPGVPVSTRQILSEVWPGIHVQPANVKAIIHELRGALGDPPVDSRFIRSEPGRGYTFVAGVTDAPVPLCAEPAEASGTALAPQSIVWSTLVDGLDTAQSGGTRIVFLEGDRGLGKTHLTRALARDARDRRTIRLTCGETADGPGSDPPCGVIVDALALLGRQYPALVDGLRQAAPAWHRSLAAAGASQELIDPTRLRRELPAALAHLSNGAALLIVLEDLQWADPLTIDALRHLARSSVPTGTCVVATAATRVGTMAGDLERLFLELAHEPTTRVMRLRPFAPAEVERYLQRRFGLRAAKALAPALVDATAGLPHWLALAIDSLQSLGCISPSGHGWNVHMPPTELAALAAISVSDLWRLAIERLDEPTRGILEAGACFGIDFTAEAVAALLREDDDRVAGALTREVARGQFLTRASASTVAPARYAFRSPLLVDLLSARTSVRIGMALPFDGEGAHERRA